MPPESDFLYSYYHPVAILTIGIIKLEYFLLNLDWVVLEFTIIRTAAEGSKYQYIV